MDLPYDASKEPSIASHGHRFLSGRAFADFQSDVLSPTLRSEVPPIAVKIARPFSDRPKAKPYLSLVIRRVLLLQRRPRWFLHPQTDVLYRIGPLKRISILDKDRRRSHCPRSRFTKSNVPCTLIVRSHHSPLGKPRSKRCLDDGSTGSIFGSLRTIQQRLSTTASLIFKAAS